MGVRIGEGVAEVGVVEDKVGAGLCTGKVEVGDGDRPHPARAASNKPRATNQVLISTRRRVSILKITPFAQAL